MSNYAVTTNFGAKDSLSSGNPAKLILGAQLTTEFNNIATSIATKYDSTTTTITLTGAFSAAGITSSAGATISGGAFASRGIADNATATALTLAGAGAATLANGLTVNGAALAATAGLAVSGGTFASRGIADNATANSLTIGADGGVTIGTPSGGDQGAGTLNIASGLSVNGAAVAVPTSGTFTGTLTGCTTSPTQTFNYVIVGNTATIYLVAGGLVATSNTTACTVTGVPAALTPVNPLFVVAPCIENSGSISTQQAAVSGTTLVLSATVAANNTAGAFGNTLAKGLSAGFSITYPLK